MYFWSISQACAVACKSATPPPCVGISVSVHARCRAPSPSLARWPAQGERGRAYCCFRCKNHDRGVLARLVMGAPLKCVPSSSIELSSTRREILTRALLPASTSVCTLSSNVRIQTAKSLSGSRPSIFMLVLATRLPQEARTSRSKGATCSAGCVWRTPADSAFCRHLFFSGRAWLILPPVHTRQSTPREPISEV